VRRAEPGGGIAGGNARYALALAPPACAARDIVAAVRAACELAPPSLNGLFALRAAGVYDSVHSQIYRLRTVMFSALVAVERRRAAGEGAGEGGTDEAADAADARVFGLAPDAALLWSALVRQFCVNFTPGADVI
jgi:hypothetical protein